MGKLIIIRHGQSTWNAENRFTGWVDVDLSKKGIKEAEEAGKLIKELNMDFEVYFTSYLKRAIDTLEIILKILGKDKAYIKSHALNERHYGSFTAKIKSKIKEELGETEFLRALCKYLFNISNLKINELEIPTGNPLIIIFDKNLKIEKYYYLDKEREKKIIPNQ